MEEFKSKLTEQTEGDTESLSSEEETSNPSLSGNDQEDGLSNPDSISEPVVRALAAALTKIETYVPTQYVDYTEPDINAENLNHAEQAIMRVTNALNGAVDAINQLSADIDSLNSQSQITQDINIESLVDGITFDEYGKVFCSNGILGCLYVKFTNSTEISPWTRFLRIPKTSPVSCFSSLENGTNIYTGGNAGSEITNIYPIPAGTHWFTLTMPLKP